MTTQNVEARSRIWWDWDAPRDQLLRGFAAAASFYRQAPWLSTSQSRYIRAILLGGHRWTLDIHGPRDCGMYAYISDEDGQSPHEHDAYDDGLHRCISLSFGTQDRMPDEARRGIRELKGEVAGAEAYPLFQDLSDEGPDFTLGDLEEVISIVEAVPRYVKARQQLITAEGVLARRPHVLRHVRWTDDASGVQFEDVLRDE